MAKKDPKKWIEEGLVVEHVLSNRRIVVEEIVRIPQVSESSGSMLKGILCHWIDDHGTYQKGIFHTRELRPLTMTKEEREEIDSIKSKYPPE